MTKQTNKQIVQFLCFLKNLNKKNTSAVFFKRVDVFHGFTASIDNNHEALFTKPNLDIKPFADIPFLF